MKLALGVRSEIALNLLAVACLSGVSLLAVLLPDAQRTAMEARAHQAEVVAAAAAKAALAACPGQERACLQSVLARMVGGEVLGFELLDSPPKERRSDRATGLAPLGPSGGLVEVELSRVKREHQGPAGRRIAVAIGVQALAVLLAGMFLLGRAIGRPVDELLAATERIGRGELEAGIGLEGGRALGRLGRGFDRMSSSLKMERERLREHIGALESANTALADARQNLYRSEKLATVGQLAAGVAHEVGNPLSAILGYLDLLRSKGVTEAGREYVEAIERDVRRIDRIVRDLLDFARPASLRLQSVKVQAAVEGALRLLSGQKRFHGVAVSISLGKDLPQVQADEHYVAQVLVNLLLNAADAMRGTGKIEISAAPAGSQVRLDVRDQGPGIPPENLSRIFDPFFTTKAPGEGTGLGLSICHGLMESFGGHIAAENADGGGARFSLWFRASKADS